MVQAKILFIWILGTIIGVPMGQTNTRCGVPKPKENRVIVRGIEADPDDWPWHSAILHVSSQDGQLEYKCGGVLIHQNFVITAKHCVLNEGTYYPLNAAAIVVQLGIQQRYRWNPNLQEHLVLRVHTLSDNGAWSDLRNDVAILALRTSVQFNAHVLPACLINREVVPGEVGTVIGFGLTESTRLSSVLRMVTMPVVNPLGCLRADRTGYGNSLDEGLFCAGFQNGTTVCNGDSGGGFYMKVGNAWHLAGIVAFSLGRKPGDNRCKEDTYGAFTSIPWYLNWIRNVMGFSEHTLYTQLQNQGQGGVPTFQQQPPQTQQPIYQPAPQPVQPQQQEPWWNMFNSQTNAPPQTVRPTRPQPPRTTTTPYRPPPPRTTVATSRPQSIRTTVAPPASSSSYSCGKPSATFLNRLSINGERVDKGQFPWIAPLFDQHQQPNPKYMCGSTIISNRFLVTAAHCVYDVDEFMEASRIVAIPGMYNIENFFDENANIADIDEIIASGEYIQDEDLTDADVAVLKLKRTLQWTDYIIPICPWQGENDISRVVGQEGIVVGWGIPGQGTNVPTYIKTVIVDRRQCSINLQRIYPANARILCGDRRSSTPCNGNSGSGLVIKRGNQYYLRGVVSKGQVDPNTLKCDVTKYVIYTDIAPFRFWLKQVTQS